MSNAGQSTSPEPAATPDQTSISSARVRRERQRILYMAAAHLLRYPDDAFREMVPEITTTLGALADTAPAALLLRASQQLQEADPFALAAGYVATFDLSARVALYLTAHEFGESRRRGIALVELRQMLRAAGFEPWTAELPDYLPLLLEFLAHAPEDFASQGLEQRLAAVCDRIRGKLDEDSPYHLVFRALLGLLPEPAPAADGQPRFPQREQADTGLMPFPLRYD